MEGNFKGFAMLRQMTLTQADKTLPGWENAIKPQPVYIQVRTQGRLEPEKTLPCCEPKDRRHYNSGGSDLLPLVLAGLRVRASLAGKTNTAPPPALVLPRMVCSDIGGPAPEPPPLWPGASAWGVAAFS